MLYSSSQETTRVNGVEYDVIALRKYMEQVKPEEVLVEDLSHVLAEGHDYWVIEDGSTLGPHKILQDWEAAQKNPLWKKHVESIKNAQPDTYPIWVFKEEGQPDFVFDGVHRLINAVLFGRDTIRTRSVATLPDWAKLPPEPKE